MSHLLIAVLSIIASTSAFADSAEAVTRITDREAARIIRKAFAPVCGSDALFRCPYSLEDPNKSDCPVQAVVLLPLGPNGTYDGRSQPAWISLSAEGAILAISLKKETACPFA